MAKIQSQSTTNPSSISQAAVIEALNGDQSFIKERSDAFKERRDFVVTELNKIPEIGVNLREHFMYFRVVKAVWVNRIMNLVILKLVLTLYQVIGINWCCCSPRVCIWIRGF